MPILVLSGCGNSDKAMEEGMQLRQKMLSSAGCSFDATVTADYGDEIYEFTLSCQADERGDLGFTVISPDSISGVTGTVSGTGGKLLRRLRFGSVLVLVITVFDKINYKHNRNDYKYQKYRRKNGYQNISFSIIHRSSPPCYSLRRVTVRVTVPHFALSSDSVGAPSSIKETLCVAPSLAKATVVTAESFE